MHESLRWQRDASTLSLYGELNRDTLLALWQQRDTLIDKAEIIDVSGLARVDSAGLALLVHLREEASQQGVTLTIEGITDRLSTLIALYNLQDIIPAHSS